MSDDRMLSEREFHDAQAADRAQRLRDLASLRFRDADYLDHATWIRPAFGRLGPLTGKRVLDYGCGHGMAAVVMARHGAEVVGFDLSSGYIAEARRRATANEVVAEFLVANAEALPFADQSFDAVWGSAILHHLDLTVAGRELRRVLRPGGVAVFCEPWGGNPLLQFGRRFIPYPGKDRTPDERPLTRRDLAPLRAVFPRVKVRGHEFLAMARRLFHRAPRAGGLLDRMDRGLLYWAPWLGGWCRYVVIELQV